MSLLENSLDLILENNNIKNSKFIDYLVDNIQYTETKQERKESIERRMKIVLKLCDILIKNNALLAGGSVLGAFSNFKIKDLDIYVNQKDAMNIYKDLVTLRYNNVDEQCIAPAYDQSFFRKNHILSRFRFDHETFIPIDIMIISDDIKLTDVVTNFDLSFCEIWFDGQNVYAVDSEGIKNKTGMLKSEYSEALFKYFNKFISNRIKKYSYRGFKIFYSNSKPCTFIYNHSEIKTISDPNGTVELVDEEDDMNVYPEEWAVKKVLSTFYKKNCRREFDLYYYFTLKQFTYKELFEMLKRYYHISSQSYGTYSYISSDLQSIPFPREYKWVNPENPRYPEDASPKFKKRRVDLKVKLIIKYLIFSTSLGRDLKYFDNGIWAKSKKSEKWRMYLNDVLNADIKNEEGKVINGEDFYVDFFDYSDNSLSSGRNHLLTDIIFIENLLEPRESTRKMTLEKDDEGYVEGGDNVTIYKDYINLKEYEIKDAINEYYLIINQRSSITYYRHNYLIPNDFEILDDGYSEVTMNDWLNENPTNIIFLYDSDQTDSINGIKGLGLSKDALYQLYSNLIVECKESYASNVSITKEKVFFDKIYYKSSVGDSYNNGILLSKLNSVKDEVEKENGSRIFYLTSKKLLKTIASLSNVYVYPNLNIYGSIIDVVSGTHCGEGQQSYVYDEIYIINKHKLASREKFNEIIEKNLIPHDREDKTDPHENILRNISRFVFNILKNGSGKKPDMTGLMEAIRDGRTDDALTIIDGVDYEYLNSQDNDGNTALMFAADLGDFSIVEKLLEKEVDITLQDKRGDTALTIAGDNGFINIVDLLLETIPSESGMLLIDAIKQDDYKLVRELMELNTVDINLQDEDGNTALIFACKNDNYDIVKLLVDKGADINVQNNNGISPLLAACYNINDKNAANIAKLLITKGADVNSVDKDQATPLTVILEQETYGLYGNIVKMLLKNEADVNYKTYSGFTPLMLACASETYSLNYVRILINNEADIDAKNNDNETALMFACEDGLYTIAKLLVYKGADVNIKNNDGETAYTLARDYEHDRIVKLLYKAGAEDDILADYNEEFLNSEDRTAVYDNLIKGIKHDDLDIVREILRNNEDDHIDFNYKDLDGNTLLILAVKVENENIVKILVDHGANVNETNDNKQTPLMYAVILNYINIVKYLLKNGADVNLRDGDDHTINDYANIYGVDDKIMALLEENNYDQLDYSDNKSMLIEAIKRGNINAVSNLAFVFGMDLDTQDGNTRDIPLILATKLDNEIIVRILIDAGANVDIKDDNGNTALMISSSKGNENITRILIDAGADMNIKNNERNNALILATNNGHENISRILISAGAFETRVDYEESKSVEGDEESKSAEGETDIDEHPLITAAKNGEYRMVWALIDNDKVDYDNIVDNEYGMNALMWAVKNGHLNIVNDIINVGADVNLGDKNGKTALIHAVESGNKEIVEYLLDNDADITLEDDEGRDAIAYARIYDDNEQILDLLREHSDRYVNRYDSGENYYEGKYIDERRSPKRNRNRDGEIIYEY